MQYAHDPNCFSVFFRNTTVELETNLWPEAVKMYKPYLEHSSGPLKGKWKSGAKIKDKAHEIIFPSGSKSKFAYMAIDKDADAYYGSELSRCYWDEFQRFSPYQFDILRSRLRSKANFKSVMRMTLNPDPTHFCYNWVKAFLDDEGYPIKDLSGKTRYYLIVSGELYTAWDKNELLEQFPNKNPLTYTYIPCTLADNKILEEMEPDYRDSLDSMPEAKRKQLLLGCWAKSEDEGTLFQRGWLTKVSKDKIPSDLKYVRAYDLASECPTENNRHPDWTYSVLMGKSTDGFYYLMDATRMRERPGARNQMILDQARKDAQLYGDVTIITAIDPGAAGKVAFQEFSKQIVEAGYSCKSDPVPNNKSKKTKYTPVSDSTENGLVYVCEELFDPEILEDFYRQNELFDGVTRSSSHRKDD